MKPTRRVSLAAQCLILLTCAMASVSLGLPADIVSSPAPAVGADPPKRVEVGAGDAKVSPQTGALTYSYGFTVPPGRNGVQPSLNLSYSSQAPLSGDVAAGWSFGLPTIKRDLSVGLAGPERWISSLAGSRELVPVTESAPAGAQTFRAQADSSYARYQLTIDQSQHLNWQVLTTDGMTYAFDTATDGWHRIRRVSDQFGNTTEYTWAQVPWLVGSFTFFEQRLERIEYTSNQAAQLPSHAKVEFEYAASPPLCAGMPVGAQRVIDGQEQPLSWWQYGLLGASQLVAVKTFVRPAPGQEFVPVRRWNLDYDAGAASCTGAHAPIRLLTRIREVDVTTGGLLRPPVIFAYGDLDRTLSSSISVSFPPSVPQAQRYGWGNRINTNGKHSTLEAQLADLSGDARPDRVFDATPPASENPSECVIGWQRNQIGATVDVEFAPSPETTPVPSIPWTNAPLPPANGYMSGNDDCSLSGQLTFYSNKTPDAGDPICVGQHLGNYNAYRYMDLDADGLTDLVTALHYDPAYLDPPPVPPPPADQTGPACVVMDAAPVDAAMDCRDGGGYEVCDIDWSAMTTIVDSSPREEFFYSAAQRDKIYNTRPPLGIGYWFEEALKNLTDPPKPPTHECVPVQKPQERDGRYPWTWYRGLGDGTFDVAHPRMTYAPLPLQSHSGEPVNVFGGGAGQTQAIIDLDGDGYLDAVSTPSRWHCESPVPVDPCDIDLLWTVMYGGPDGNFHGRDLPQTPEFDNRAYLWHVPRGAFIADTVKTNASPPGAYNAWEWQGLHDVNGDGRPDLFFGGKVYLNQGRINDVAGAFAQPPITLPFAESANSYTEPLLEANGYWGDHYTTARFGDFDGDGRIDWYQRDGSGNPTIAWLTAGALGPAVSIPAAGVMVESSSVDGTPQGGPWYVERTAVDLDGDGLVEAVDSAGGTAATETRDGTFRALLATVDNGYGLTTSITYSPASYGTAVDLADGILPRPTWVVESIESTDLYAPLGPFEEKTIYHYVGPVWNQDMDGKWGFRGFDETRATGPSGAVTVSKFGYVVDWSGRLDRTEVYVSEAARAAGTPHSIDKTAWTRYSALFSGAIATFHPSQTWKWTCQPGQTVSQCESTGALFRTINGWSPIPNSGPVLYALIQEQLLDHLGGLVAGDRRNRNQYNGVYYGPSLYRLRVANEYREIFESAGVWPALAHTRHVYNADGKSEVRTDVWQDATRFASTQRTFDPDTGNLLAVKKPEQYAASSPAETTYAYDPWNIHVAFTTNELGHVVSTVTDVGTGLVTQTNGPNCKVGICQESRTVYDALGRPTESWVTVDDATQGYVPKQVGRTTYQDFAAPEKVISERRIDYDGAEWVTVETKSDGHGRPFEETTRLFDGVLPDAVTTWKYDHRGHVVEFHTPDPSVDSGGMGVTYSYVYDSLGRPTAFFDPRGNGLLLTYAVIDGQLVKTRAECVLLPSGQCVTASDPSAPAAEVLATTILTSDVFGHLVKVQELQTDGQPATTTYEYTQNDDIKRIVNADGLETLLEHDWAHQRTRITRTSDPGATRSWSYSYNLNGKLVAEVLPYPSGSQASLYTTTFAYDDLDRETSRLPAVLDHDSATLQQLAIGSVLTSYDAGDNAKGQVTHTEVNAPVPGTPKAIAIDWQYDALGRMTSETRGFNLSAAGFPALYDSRTVSRTYNALGGEVDTVHADGLTQIRKTYDRRGLPRQILSLPYLNVLATVSHNVAGRLTRFDASNKSQQHSFDELGRLTSLVGKRSALTYVTQSYAYGATSEVMQLSSTAYNLAPRSFTLSYDDQHQLEAASDTGGYLAAFAYSPGGKLQTTNVAGAGPYLPPLRDVVYRYDDDPACGTPGSGPLYPDAEAVKVLCNAQGGGWLARYQYDSLGNVTQRERSGVGISTFEYDGDAQRRATDPSGASELYFYDPSGQRTVALERSPSGSATRVRFWFGETEVWYSGTGAVTHRYAHVGHGMPILRMQSTPTTNEPEVLFTNPLGHTLAAIRWISGGQGQNPTTTYQYGPFGEILAQYGETGTHLRRFNGKDHDQISGLYYYGYRYFDPLALQWTQADPLLRFAPDAAGASPRRAGLYGFDLNNPMRNLDPDGLWPSFAGPVPLGPVAPEAITNEWRTFGQGLYDSSEGIPLVSTAAYSANVATGWDPITRSEADGWSYARAATLVLFDVATLATAGEVRLAYNFGKEEIAVLLSNAAKETAEATTVAAARATAEGGGVYSFPDLKAGGTPYYGQTSSFARRLGEHQRAGRCEADSPVTLTSMPESTKLQRELVEYMQIQRATGGVPARESSAVSNVVDPIGPRRRSSLQDAAGQPTPTRPDPPKTDQH